MLRCIISTSTQQKVMELFYMNASGSLLNMFILLERGKFLSFFQLISNLMTWDTKNAKIKSPHLLFYLLEFIWIHGENMTTWTFCMRKTQAQIVQLMITQLLICPAGRKRNDFNSLLQGYMIDSLRFKRLLKELSVPRVIMTWHLVYSEVEEYIILTITVLLRDESLLPHSFASTAVAFGPQGCPYTQRSWFPLFRCDTHLIPLLFVTHYFQLSGEKKRCINNVFLGCIHPRINDNTKTIYKDGWLKAIFDHFHCAQSLLPFLSARWDSIISKCL